MSNQVAPVQAMVAMIWRDLTLAARRRAELANPVVFFLIVVSLFPLGVGPEPEQLKRMAPGVILVAALLATILSFERLFRSDYEDGALDQMLVSHQPLWMLVLGKITAHWLVSGLPLILISPILAILMQLDGDTTGVLVLALLLATPALSLIGSIGVGLTIGLSKGGVLLSLIVLPLYVPVLIFASSAVKAAQFDLPHQGQLALLGAIALFALLLAPFAVAAALRISSE